VTTAAEAATVSYALFVGRPLRQDEAGAIAHVSARGNGGRPIYLDDVDRRIHLGLLEAVVRDHAWQVLAWCQMTNHFHLLVRLLRASLSCGMQELNGEYARRWNRRHRETGHLFRNRFMSSNVMSDTHLVVSARYIDLNPVRAGLVRSADEWDWSSHRALTGLAYAPPFLADDELLPLLGPTPASAHRAYRRFTLEGILPDGHVLESLLPDDHIPVSDTGGSAGRAAASDTGGGAPRAAAA
jgi:REP element-mobilizing transposase RayT